MIDAQAWFVRDVILGRIEVPDQDARAADVVDRIAREDAGEDDYDAIRYQGAYVGELISETDYPSFDIPRTNDEFFAWKKNKKTDIMTFRNKSHTSVMTGKLSPPHHTPWIDALDDSMEAYIGDGK